MPLPVINHPTYNLTLPISKIELTYRPFVEKERKILLMTLESEDSMDIMNTIIQILTNCVVKSNKELVIENLTTIDVEYFFLHLRAKSIGEIVILNFRCDNELTDIAGWPNGPCGNIMQPDVDITTVTVTDVPKTDVIKLTPTIGVKMKYPNFKNLEQYATVDDNVMDDNIHELLANSIDYVVEDETIYYAKDFTKDDMRDFLMNLTTEQFHKIETFIETLPSLVKKINHTCKKCGFNHEITISGYQSFFV